MLWAMQVPASIAVRDAATTIKKSLNIRSLFFIMGQSTTLANAIKEAVLP
jgi:hypothetical protein